jgi:transposase InsO family protein
LRRACWRASKRRSQIAPGRPWENGYNESFSGKLRYELPDGEIFNTLKETKILVEHGESTSTPSGHPGRSATACRRRRPSELNAVSF